MVALRPQVTSPALSHSYIWQHIEIGYVQGMCDLLAPLLVILDDGEWVALLCFPCPCVGMCGEVPAGWWPFAVECLEVWSRIPFVPGAHPGARGNFLEGGCSSSGAALPLQQQ